MTLRADTKQPQTTLVDVKKGGQVYAIDTKLPLVRWSNDYTITSLGTGDGFDLIVVTTAGVTQYALVNTRDTSNRRPAPWQSPPPPINLVPERVPSKQPPGDGSFNKYAWTGTWEDGWSPYGAWVVRPSAAPNYPPPPTLPPVFVLVHGGPLSIHTLAGMDGLASWIGARGGIGVAVKYPMLIEDGTWTQGVQAIQQAIAKGKKTGAPVTLVGHSAGGLFISLVAFGAVPGPLPDRVVWVAADDQVGNWPQPTQPPNPRALYGANTLPVVVVTGTGDLISTVTECQAIVDELARTRHPGRWFVIEPAGHSDILSDVNFINALL